MKGKFIILVAVILLQSLNLFSQCDESFHDFSARDIDGNALSMSSFQGKKVLVVNTASFCGWTDQYEDLQELYAAYGGDNGYNFEIIGFPANNFANQEPYDEDSISGVCDSYGVTFTMMSKISVTGADQHEIYQWLTQESRNCVQDATVTWNFNKFLINPDGSWHAKYSQMTNPTNSSIVSWITEPASAEDKVNEQEFKVYISNDELIINFDFNERSVVLLNLRSMTGALIKHIDSCDINSNRFKSNVSELSSGVYIVEVITNNQKITKKVFIN